MSNAKTLTSLIDDVPPEARQHVVRLLRQVVHDIATPLSTVSMEVFSAKILLGELRPSTSAGLRSGSGKALSDLEEICSNLERASSSLARYADALSGLASADPAEADDDRAAPVGDERGEQRWR